MWFRLPSIAISSAGWLALLAYSAHPGRSLFAGLPLLATAIVASCLQLLFTLLALLVPRLRVRRRVSALILAAWLPVLGVSRTLIPLRARVLLSEPWLRSNASRLLELSRPTTEPHLVGFFRFENAEVRARVGYFSTGSFGLFGEAGIAYAPDGLPPGQDREDPWYDHLYGPWWRYSFVD